MRINDTQSRVWAVDGVGKAPDVSRTEGDRGAQSAEAVKVSLSERARALSERPAPLSAEGFDAAKVERLRAELADGSFTVDADLIAQRMLDEI